MMKICENGIVREMTDEEIQRHNELEQCEQPITAEERIEALEAALLELMGVVLNG